MLTADLVNARRRGDTLHLVSLDDDARARVLALAEELVRSVESAVGEPQEDVLELLAGIDVGSRDYRTRDGLVKLLTDRCTFDAPVGPDPEDVRRDVFTRASAMRASLEPGETLDRNRVLAEIAHERQTTPDALERALFADLRGALVLTAFDPIDPPSLVQAYERGQAQAVLLRAVKITVDVRAASPGATRALFRRLKFLRLLHVITRTDEGYRVVIDGPFSMFESVTKYGLQLALVLPMLDGCDAWKLEADIRWGKEKRPLTFRLEGGCPGSSTKHEPPLTDEVKTLVRSFTSNDLGWLARANQTILELPGVGLTVPDLVFERKGEGAGPKRVYFEVMGYWSRAAVWQRVELVQAGLATPIVFAVSSRLRVSEEVLGDDLPGALYVYKGTMNARAIAAKLNTLAER